MAPWADNTRDKGEAGSGLCLAGYADITTAIEYRYGLIKGVDSYHNLWTYFNRYHAKQICPVAKVLALLRIAPKYNIHRG
jgi:hypothetical protein